MKVHELIEILKKCDPNDNIGTFANNHFTDSSHYSKYSSQGGISVAKRLDDVIIGNFSDYGLPTQAPYSDQFRDNITVWYRL